MEYPKCPMCEADYTYEQDSKFMCPMCQHEWVASDSIVVIKDAFGNVLKDGDSVTLVKELKVKGSTQSLKQGTKVKNIRLVEGDHNIDCKIDGFGAMSLKSEFVKKI